MGPHVLVELELLSECLSAQVALEGTFARVFVQVPIHVIPSFGRVVAQPAAMLATLDGHE